MNLKRKILASTVASLALASTQAIAVPVGTELLLLADVSGSLDGTDFALQRDGYASAFRDTDVIDAIVNSGGAAVSLVYWSSSSSVAVDWYHITDSITANAFADAIAAAPRSSSGSTGMTSAINYGTGLFDNNFEGDYNVIDVSGDGSESVACSYSSLNCGPLQAARDAALASGIDRINALWIEDEAQPSSRNYFCLDASCIINPLEYGSTNVIGGTDSFQYVVSDFAGFSAAIKQKLIEELTPPSNVPEPAVLGLLGLGLLGMGASRRRKHA